MTDQTRWEYAEVLVGANLRIIDVACHGPREVRVLTIKSFEEPANEMVRRRIAAPDSDRFTRAGAAVRHSTAVLAAQAARCMLLRRAEHLPAVLAEVVRNLLTEC